MELLSDKVAALSVQEGKEKELTKESDSKLKFRTGVVYDARMQAHKEWSGYHPESPQRIARIWAALNEAGIVSKCLRVPARDATQEEIVLVHSKTHYEQMVAAGNMKDQEELSMCILERRYNSIYMNQSSFACALLSAGSVCEVTNHVLSGKVENAIAVVRPPGHHAECHTAMGFCFFNNVAIAAQMAVEKFGLKKVLIVDWDIHHGNATQHMFYDDKRVLYMSLHRYDHGLFFPGSTDANYFKIGRGDGLGYNVNVAWNDASKGDGDYLSAFHQVILPVAREFDPQLVLVSCGFDSGLGDPLGCYEVTPEGYAHMTHMLRGIANGKMVVALEGGYNLSTISESMCAVARVLLGEAPPVLESPCVPSESAQKTITELAQTLAPHWKSLHHWAAQVNPSASPEPTAKSTVCKPGMESEDVIPEEGQLFAVYPLAWCQHLDEIAALPEKGLDTSVVCEACDVVRENWVCLSCFHVYCGRYINQHMLRHSEQTGHKIALSFADLSVWCFACDSYVHNKMLIPYIDSAHRYKFGEPTPLPAAYEDKV